MMQAFQKLTEQFILISLQEAYICIILRSNQIVTCTEAEVAILYWWYWQALSLSNKKETPNKNIL